MEHPSYFPPGIKSPATLIDVKDHFHQSMFDVLQSGHKINNEIKKENASKQKIRKKI